MASQSGAESTNDDASKTSLTLPKPRLPSVKSSSQLSDLPSSVPSNFSPPHPDTHEASKATSDGLGMRRSCSVDDIFMRYGSRLTTEFEIDDFDDATSQASVDSFAASEGEVPAPSKVSQWTTPNRSFGGITEEGDNEEDSVTIPSGSITTCKKYSKRGLGSAEPQRCQQSLLWRWLATTAVPPAGQLPVKIKAPKHKSDSGEEAACKEISFAFQSRDLNAVAPSNF